jgi:ankyrin repeat protein
MMEKRRVRIREAFAKARRILFHKMDSEKLALSSEEQKRLNDALLNAAWHGNNAELVRLIKAGADISAKNSEGWGDALTVLWEAIDRGYNQTCALIIEEYAKAGGNIKRFISVKSYENWTVLHLAASNGRTQTCILLIEEYVKSGGNANKLISAKNNDGKTATMIAEAKHKKETAAFLTFAPFAPRIFADRELSSSFYSSFNECISQ